MDSEHRGEFDVVERMACDGLRSGIFTADEGWPICRFVALPSFSNPVAWDVRSVHVRSKAGVPRLFRSCWRRDLDYQALGSPVERLRRPRPYLPTVEVASAPIDAGQLEGLIDRFRRIPVPLGVATPTMGCDGVNYELEIGHFFCNARIAWWIHLPEEWSALGPVIEELAALLKSPWPDA